MVQGQYDRHSTSREAGSGRREGETTRKETSDWGPNVVRDGPVPPMESAALAADSRFPISRFPDGYLAQGRPLRLSAPSQVAGLLADRPPHARARHWREQRDLQCGEHGAAPAVSLSRPGTAHDRGPLLPVAQQPRG